MRGFQGRVPTVVAWITVLVAAAAGAADKKKPKPAVVEMQGLKVTVDGSKINIDGAVHNSGERTIEKLVLSFHFFDTEHNPVSTLKLDIDDATIDPGDENE